MRLSHHLRQLYPNTWPMRSDILRGRPATEYGQPPPLWPVPEYRGSTNSFTIDEDGSVHAVLNGPSNQAREEALVSGPGSPAWQRITTEWRWFDIQDVPSPWMLCAIRKNNAAPITQSVIRRVNRAGRRWPSQAEMEHRTQSARFAVQLNTEFDAQSEMSMSSECPPTH